MTYYICENVIQYIMKIKRSKTYLPKGKKYSRPVSVSNSIWTHILISYDLSMECLTLGQAPPPSTRIRVYRVRCLWLKNIMSI